MTLVKAQYQLGWRNSLEEATLGYMYKEERGEQQYQLNT
jgi:hypothetical protein